MKRISALIAAMCLTTPVAAQDLRDCDTYEANARNTYPPYEETIRSYANGDIRMIALDVGEPAAAAFHLLVIHPIPDEPFPGCTLISYQGNSGFGWLNMGAIAADYDPATGLFISVPMTTYDPDSTGQLPGEVNILINQATGTVSANATSADVASPTNPGPTK